MDKSILERLAHERTQARGGFRRYRSEATTASTATTTTTSSTTAATTTQSHPNDDHDQSTPCHTPPQSSMWSTATASNSNTECITTTPMTTRPHFYMTGNNGSPFSSSPQHRRQRSRSLGSAGSGEHNALSGDRSTWTEHLLAFPSYTYGSSLAQQQQQHAVPPDTGALHPAPEYSAPHLPNLQKRAHTTIARDEAEQHLGGDGDSTKHDVAAADSVESSSSNVGVCIVYGLINATMVLPITMSFGSIIYRDDALAPYISVFVKLTIASGVVHQVCFSTFSTLPFCVGQVQDAGLIFLSVMASNIVKYGRSHDYDEATLLATVSVGLSLATCLLGFGLLLVGYGRLAQYMQLLPTCVVGGYLAYIGLFCGMAGVGLMVGSADVSLSIVWTKFLFILPGVLGGAGIYYALSRVRHMATLPASIAIEIALFYIVLWATGTTIDEATTLGWIRQMDPASSSHAWYHSWDFLQFDKVDWMALPSLIGTEWLAMLFVCALSSSLDVAALELELNRPLDYNHELKMIGLSNVLSGATGGYTGSYIFSQSIFSLRAGVRSRLAGYVLALCEAIFIVLPFPILAYIPNFFFGSLLFLISIDLMYEWLWDIRKKLTAVEFAICWATFGCINIIKVEYGILAGVALYMLCFKLGLNVGGASKFAPPPSLATPTGSSTANKEDIDTNENATEDTALLLLHQGGVYS